MRSSFFPRVAFPATHLALFLATVTGFAGVDGPRPEPGASGPATVEAEGAQGSESVAGSDSLVEGNNSSPRQTMRNFLEYSTRAIENFHAGAPREEIFYELSSAADALDFSNTPSGDSWSVKITRVLLLRELLDRIQLPPEQDIPGRAEVAASGIDKWTVPGTRINLTRVEAGPRKAEFLFSPGTVERLERLYRRSSDQPYQPGAISRGIYETYVASDDTMLAESARVRQRLKPVDTHSPRSTLEGFMMSMNEAYRIIMAARAALNASPPTMTRRQARAAESVADNLVSRAVKTLDLDKVPEALRRQVGVETALQIKEVIDRVSLPTIESVPDLRDVRELRTRDEQTPIRWRLPNTEIEIVELEEGDRAGEFLFSARTVRNAESYYREVADLPSRATSVGFSQDWSSPDVSIGFYPYYSTTPGYLVPGADHLTAIVEHLPSALKRPFKNHLLWQWLGLILVVLASVAAVLFTSRLTGRAVRAAKPPFNDWLRLVSPLAAAAIVRAALAFLDRDINLTGTLLGVVTGVCQAVILLALAYASFLAFRAVAEGIIHWREDRMAPMNASLMRVIALIFGIMAAAFLFVAGARRVGADVVPLLAGLGVGGLAVALAAQKTLANFIGTLILLANRPVREGDFCLYGDNRVGTVERIGLHSTRIRTLERTVVTIPNADFSEMELENFALRDERRFKTSIGLRYETSADQLRFLLVRLRELLLGHPKVSDTLARARFVGFGAYSKDVEVTAYLRCTGQNEFLAVQEDLLLRINDIVQESGSDFAFPSQTTYFARAGDLDAEQVQAAEMEVSAWRARGKLPFPDFDEEDQDRLEDILDYPPKGSPRQ